MNSEANINLDPGFSEISYPGPDAESPQYPRRRPPAAESESLLFKLTRAFGIKASLTCASHGVTASVAMIMINDATGHQDNHETVELLLSLSVGLSIMIMLGLGRFRHQAGTAAAIFLCGESSFPIRRPHWQVRILSDGPGGTVIVQWLPRPRLRPRLGDSGRFASDQHKSITFRVQPEIRDSRGPRPNPGAGRALGSGLSDT